jgi:hypothetical protein
MKFGSNLAGLRRDAFTAGRNAIPGFSVAGLFCRVLERGALRYYEISCPSGAVAPNEGAYPVRVEEKYETAE